MRFFFLGGGRGSHSGMRILGMAFCRVFYLLPAFIPESLEQ